MLPLLAGLPLSARLHAVSVAHVSLHIIDQKKKTYLRTELLDDKVLRRQKLQHHMESLLPQVRVERIRRLVPGNELVGENGRDGVHDLDQNLVGQNIRIEPCFGEGIVVQDRHRDLEELGDERQETFPTLNVEMFLEEAEDVFTLSSQCKDEEDDCSFSERGIE